MAPVRQSNSILGWLGWRLGFPQAYRWHHRITSLIKSAWLHGYISMSVSFNLEDSCLQWAAYEYLTGMCSAKSKTEYLQTQTHVKVIFPNKQQKPTTSSYPPHPQCIQHMFLKTLPKTHHSLAMNLQNVGDVIHWQVTLLTSIGLHLLKRRFEISIVKYQWNPNRAPICWT